MSSVHMPLHRVAEINARSLPEGIDGDFEIMYADLASVDLDSAVVQPRRETFASAPSRARRLVSLGDSLIPSLTGGSSWTQTRPLLVSSREVADVVFSTGFFSVSPSSQVEARYLNYSVSALSFLSELEAISTGVTMRGFTAEQLGRRLIRVLSLAEQTAIADYLDAETARIDALIAKKQRLVEVVVERGNLALERAMTRRGVPWPISLEELEAATAVGECRVIHLSQCLDQLTNGYVGPTRDILADDGIRYVQSLHIKGGRIDFDRRPFFVTPEWHAERPRIHLRENDVLIVQTGDIGQVAVVPPGFGEASCHALQIARVRPSVLLGPFLAEYLRSDLGYQSLLSRATGALHPHLEGGIRTVPVIVPSLQVQREVIEEVAEARRYAADVSARLARQIDLLREHRQALITAAVTGKLEIPGVAA